MLLITLYATLKTLELRRFYNALVSFGYLRKATLDVFILSIETEAQNLHGEHLWSTKPQATPSVRSEI